MFYHFDLEGFPVLDIQRVHLYQQGNSMQYFIGGPLLT